MQTFSWSIAAIPTPPSPSSSSGSSSAGGAASSGNGIRNLLLDPLTWDLVVTNGQIQTIPVSVQAIAQAVRAALQLLAGEWFNDPTLGLPWFPPVGGGPSILGPKNVSSTFIRQQLTSAILAVEGTTSVPVMNVSTVGRTLNVQFQVTTDVGLITGTGATS